MRWSYQHIWREFKSLFQSKEQDSPSSSRNEDGTEDGEGEKPPVSDEKPSENSPCSSPETKKSEDGQPPVTTKSPSRDGRLEKVIGREKASYIRGFYGKVYNGKNELAPGIKETKYSKQIFSLCLNSRQLLLPAP